MKGDPRESTTQPPGASELNAAQLSVIARSDPIISSKKLRELYVKGVFRNAVFLLTSAHPEAKDYFNPSQTRSSTRPNRGSVSFDLLVYLFHTSNMDQLIKRCLLSQFKGEKQGNASLHDLGMAHSLFHSIDFAIHGKTDRSLTVNRTQSLGRIIRPLRTLTTALYGRLPVRELATFDSDRIQELCPTEWAQLIPQLKNAIRATSKFRATAERVGRSSDHHVSHAEKLERDPNTDFAKWFTADRLVRHFALLKAAGIDLRSFDEFLKG